MRDFMDYSNFEINRSKSQDIRSNSIQENQQKEFSLSEEEIKTIKSAYPNTKIAAKVQRTLEEIGKLIMQGENPCANLAYRAVTNAAKNMNINSNDINWTMIRNTMLRLEDWNYIASDFDLPTGRNNEWVQRFRENRQNTDKSLKTDAQNIHPQYSALDNAATHGYSDILTDKILNKKQEKINDKQEKYIQNYSIPEDNTTGTKHYSVSNRKAIADKREYFSGFKACYDEKFKNLYKKEPVNNANNTYIKANLKADDISIGVSNGGYGNLTKEPNYACDIRAIDEGMYNAPSLKTLRYYNPEYNTTIISLSGNDSGKTPCLLTIAIEGTISQSDAEGLIKGLLNTDECLAGRINYLSGSWKPEKAISSTNKNERIIQNIQKYTAEYLNNL